MAFKPSKRRSHEGEDIEPNLTPVMNLMVVLIPLLLSSAQFIKIGVIDLNLPPAVGSKITDRSTPRESEKKLELAVTITSDGYYISSSASIMGGKNENQPSIPILVDGRHDYLTLSKILFEIKKHAFDKFPDDDKLIIQAAPDVNYQILISTMDAARNYQYEGRLYSLFPDVSLAAGII